MLIVGAALNYSILLSVLAFFHTEGLLKSTTLNGIGLIMFGLTTIVISAKHATETVPFILQNDSGNELDAIQTVSKLKKKSIAARSVHHDFVTMKNLVQDEIEKYGEPNFKKVFLPENRKSLIFCCYGRLCSVLSFNLPLVVFILIFLREAVHFHMDLPQDHHSNKHCLDFFNGNNVERHENEEISIKAPSSMGAAVVEGSKTEIEMNIEKPKSIESNDEKSDNSKNDGVKDQDKIDENTMKQENTGTEEKKDEKSKPPENESKGHENRDDGKPTTNDKNNVNDSEKRSKRNVEKQETKEKPNEQPSKGSENDEKKKEVDDQHKQGENERKPEASKNNEEQSNDKKENESHEMHENRIEIEKSSSTIFAHLIVFLHSRELTLVLLAWFIFGSITAAVLYKFNLKRFIYYISCVLSSVLFVTAMAHSLLSFPNILHICLIIYFNYVTIPIDVFGHCMLAEAFPVTLKGFSVACVSIIEHTVHIILIGLYLTETFHNTIMLSMCIVAFISHEIARNLPHKDNLSLGEAREQYQHIDLMLFNNPKVDYNQQQEFI